MALSPEHIKRAWINFKVHKDPEARVDLINHYSYLVKITAGRLVTSLPGGLDREDLIGAGVIGLIKSVDQLTLRAMSSLKRTRSRLSEAESLRCCVTKIGFRVPYEKS